MSHPRSLTTVDTTAFPNAELTTYFKGTNGKTYSYVTTSGTNTYGKTGLIKVGGRAASVKNLRDETGWRHPSAYDGRRSERLIPGLSFHRVDWAPSMSGWYHYVATNGVITPDTVVRDANISAPGSLAQSLRKSTIQKALRKFRRNSHEDQVDLAVAYAERAKTSQMVIDRVNWLIRIQDSIRRKQFATAWKQLVGYHPPERRQGLRTPSMRLKDYMDKGKRSAEAAANDWLEYRYGWKPLLGDIHGACEQIALMDAGTYSRYRIKATSRTAVKTSKSVSANCSIGVISGKSATSATVSGVQRTSASCKVVLFALRSSPGYVALADVGVGDPLVLAWEMLPYSFVVDWFLGVGNFLEAVTALRGYTYVAGSITLFEELEDTYDVRLRTEAPAVLLPPTLVGRFARTGNAFDRATLTETDLSFQSVIPNWELPSSTHMADALALLKGAFR